MDFPKTVVIDKLKEIVKEQKTFEEESVQYNYEGSDKELILNCLFFFYENLYSKLFRPFVFTDKNDNWENYHIQLEYEGKFSEVEIVYGIGAFCVIHPLNTPPTNEGEILHLDKLEVNNEMELEYKC